MDLQKDTSTGHLTRNPNSGHLALGCGPNCIKCGSCCYSTDAKAMVTYAFLLYRVRDGAIIAVTGTQQVGMGVRNCSTDAWDHYQVEVLPGVLISGSYYPGDTSPCQSGTFPSDPGFYTVDSNTGRSDTDYFIQEAASSVAIVGNRCCRQSDGTCGPGTPADDGGCTSFARTAAAPALAMMDPAAVATRRAICQGCGQARNIGDDYVDCLGLPGGCSGCPGRLNYAVGGCPLGLWPAPVE